MAHGRIAIPVEHLKGILVNDGSLSILDDDLESIKSI
jgi:hypothetical protein